MNFQEIINDLEKENEDLTERFTSQTDELASSLDKVQLL